MVDFAHFFQTNWYGIVGHIIACVGLFFKCWLRVGLHGESLPGARIQVSSPGNGQKSGTGHMEWAKSRFNTGLFPPKWPKNGSLTSWWGPMKARTPQIQALTPENEPYSDIGKKKNIGSNWPENHQNTSLFHRKWPKTRLISLGQMQARIPQI